MEFLLQSWFTVIVGSIAISIFLLRRYLSRNDDYWKKRGVPYAPRLSIFYSLWILYRKSVQQILTEYQEKYGRVYGQFAFSTPCLSVSDPELLKDIFVKDFHVFADRRNLGLNDNLLNNMVSVLNGEDWKRVRSIITPAFTSKKMRQMAHCINSCSDTLLRTFSDHSEKGASMDCKKIFGAFITDVIASSAFATKIDSLNDPNNPFVTNARTSMSIFTLIIAILYMLTPKIIWNALGLKPYDSKPMEFYRRATLQVIDERRKKGQKGNDFLQLLLDASEDVIEGVKKVDNFQTIESKDEEDHYGRIDGKSNITYTTKKLSQDELIAQCVLFFIVGYETSASTLTFLAYNLAVNPECQEKLIKEVDEVFQKTSELTYEDVQSMKYLDSCVSESLRLFPPLLATERMAAEDYPLGNTGITVTKGMFINIPIYAIHYDPENYPDPVQFKPERFIRENRQNLNPYTFLPFGAGPRNCLGMRFALMEIKMCIVNTLRRYRLRLAPETKVPLKYAYNLGFLATDPILLIVEKRADNKSEI